MLGTRMMALRRVAMKTTRTSYPALLANLPVSSNHISRRSMTTVEASSSANDAMKASCYLEIDFTIRDDEKAIVAIQKLAAYDIGCLVTTDKDGHLTGVVSERDMVRKIGLTGGRAKDIAISEIHTSKAKLITATKHDSIDACMNKMINSDVRHLPVLDDEGHVVGLLSIKDCVKAVLEEKEQAIETLSNFAMGKGGTFVVD